ncbi:hypothetical protein [Nocardioides sp. AX2bis]|uniref:hypothetical protein n=1 Tax=Nocardioides sp. AX2bis TaxID=2653157 RepID=UPI0012F04739|nr:hypothetical protein [Nocardioides sp. AX2bis]VXC44399.1 conserved hypothetical protein [Nocardioides sp. AX2bis]
MPKPLRELAPLTEAAAAEAKKSGRMLVQFINPGWGSSGYYSPAVLEAAATDGVIPAGTHMYADHPTEAEDIERPVRSIKDLMAITTEAAYLADDGALVGEVQVVPQWRDLVETVKDSIGVSIRGSATDIVEGEADGRRGGIIEGLVAPVMSVDFVTRAGRGGRVLSLLESAAANRRAVRHGVAEATVNDTREALQNVLRDTYSGENTWVWVRDFDDETVWFELETDGDGSGIYGQGYTTGADDQVVSLTGDRTEVRVTTTYVPVRPGGTTTSATSTTTEESKEDTMPQIEEARLRQLEADAGRVTALESERDTEKARADQAENALAESRRTDAARKVLVEHEATFTQLEARGLLADLPVAEDGSLDADAFKTAVDTAVAESRAASGEGRVTGNGTVTDQPTAQESARPRRNAFGREIKEN